MTRMHVGLDSDVKGFRWRCLPTTIMMALAVILLACGTASAQLAGTGAISGTVTDQSGAVVPNATVDVLALDTNEHTIRKSSSAGDYNVTPLLPGAYILTVTAPGFETFVQKNITVNALQTVAVEAKLTVGALDQTVTVTDAPPVLETTNATIGAVMDQQMYSSLPLLMGAGNNADQRRATDFASLMPGVSSYQASSSSNSTDATGGVNGGNPNGGTSDIYIDGLDLPEADGIGDPRFTWTAFSVDAINQFQVQTAGIPAQYAGQGIQNYSVKSGGNAFHGSVYEYLRNTVLDAWPTNSKLPTLTGAPVPTGGSCSSASLTASTSWCALGGLKPKEIMNEFGIVLSGPIIKNKLFLFGNYGQYRFQHGPSPHIQTAPTLAMMGYNASGQLQNVADFSGYSNYLNNSTANPALLYDPQTQTTYNCSGTACQRGQFASNQIPIARVSQAAQYFNSYMLPYESLVNQTAYTNNIVVGYSYGLANWYESARIDYNVTPSQQLSFIVAFGRQASTGPNASGAANALGPPFNTAQAYHPVTAVDVVKHTWTISSHIVNQFALAFGRYQSISVTPDELPQYAASKSGLLNTPPGQASYFPGIVFSNSYNSAYNVNSEAGYDENNKVNNTYNVTDNLQWQLGKHSLTLGGQAVEVQFNYIKNLTFSSPMSYTFSTAQTEGYSSSNGAALPNTGAAYASYMLGAVSTSSVTVGVPGLGTRWFDPSFWAQDDWKVNSKLSLNVGVRWDIFPAIHEQHDLITWLNPNATNPTTGNRGTLSYAGGNPSDGYHTGQHIPSPIWWKNVAPRLGLAYQIDPKMVIRASYGVNFARGDWTSGSQSGSPSTTGLTPSASATALPSNDPQFFWDGTACGGGTIAPGDGHVACGWTGSIAAPVPGAGYGATETQTLAGVGAVSPTYFDPYLGSRTPEYINWTFGFERQLTKDMSVSVSYVGSQGHFISVSNAMYNRNNKLPESMAGLANYTLTASGGTAQTPCSGNTCNYPILGQKATPTYLAMAQADGYTPQNPFVGSATYWNSNSVYQYYAAFPQYSGVSDTTSFVGNENWNALEISFKQRPAHGLNWMLNYTWSKGIDDLGTFRVYDNPRLDRSLSAADQPQAVVGTVVWQLPVGKGHMWGNHAIYRAIVSDWSVSDIIQLRSGFPLIVTGSGCGGSSILNTCMPSVVGGQKGRQYKFGKTSTGQTISWDPNSPNYLGKVEYVNPAAFTVNIPGTNATYGTFCATAATCPNAATQAYSVGMSSALYVPGNAARTSPINGMFSQVNFDDDLGIRRTFAVYHEWKLAFEANIANLTNHVTYGVPGASVSSSTIPTSSTNFGNVTAVASSYGPREIQIGARISF